MNRSLHGAGNRIEKWVVTNDTLVAVTRYLRDASGNVMAIYKDSTLHEQPVYGSSRLGQYLGGAGTACLTLGTRRYELSNHLGNVLTVITDNIGMSADTTWATVVSASDYYPFGLTMEGRNYQDSLYRYGFQGQERDPETNSYIYNFRTHNPEIARFWSVDPLEPSYPGWSPYAFSQNRPIDGIELEGLEWKAVNDDNGNYTGFEWDPENAYDESGNLKAGYFETAILFSEKTTPPTSGDATTFHTSATIYKADGSTEDFDATTLPSDNSKFGTVATGLYKARKGTHPMSGGYTALNVFTLDGSRFLPTQGGLPNPAGGGYDENVLTVDGVNIHKAGSDDFLGTFWSAKLNRTAGVSEGCFCIKRGSGDALYDEFMGNFKTGSDIGVLLLRTKKPTLSTSSSIEITIQTNTNTATSSSTKAEYSIWRDIQRKWDNFTYEFLREYDRWSNWGK